MSISVVGEIVCILKTMNDEIGAGLKDATETEDGAIVAFGGLGGALYFIPWMRMVV